MKFIKKNMFLTIIIGIIGLIILLSFFSIISFLFPGFGISAYGHRLDGIDKVIINNSKKTEIENNIKNDSNVNNATIDVRGNLINVIIDFNSNVTIDIAKDSSSKVIDQFTNAEKKFYDIELFLTQDAVKNNNIFPVIGYKNKYSSSVVWTNK